VRAIVLCCAVSAAGSARADDVAPPARDVAPRPIAGFKVKGKSKITDTTLGYLAHVRIGDPVSPADIPRLQAALISSELFDSAVVTLEDARDGVIVVATVHDKLSWIVGPTAYLLSTNKAVGVGYAENDFRGHDQKFLLYGQLGTQTSIFFGTFLDPSVHGTKWQYRLDVYLERTQVNEYANPPLDPTSQLISRTTQETFLDAGALVGYTFRWWLVADLRLRGGYVYFRDPHDPTTGLGSMSPERDGWDVTTQARLTIDHRFNRFGVTWGPFLQLEVEPSVPGLDSYGYFNSLLRGYYSWVMFGEHELELRSINNLGYHLPLQEDNALGGAGNLRGYPTDMFRGDLNIVLRAEYSIPLFRWWFFKFRALAFYDWGYSRFVFPRPDGGDRSYLADQLDRDYIRDDIGLGFRVYVKAVVLPLLGVDVGYGIAARSPEVVFELGLTDF